MYELYYYIIILLKLLNIIKILLKNHLSGVSLILGKYREHERN